MDPPTNQQTGPNSEFDLVDRPNGILTKDDRRFLRGELDLSDVPDSTIRHRSYRIRQRLRNALLDFLILSKNLPASDIETVFEEIHDWYDDVEAEEGRVDLAAEPEQPPLLRASRATIEFLVFGLLDQPHLVHETVSGGVADAIYEHELLYQDQFVGVPVTLNVDFENARRHTMDEFMEQVEKREFPEDEEEAAAILSVLIRTNRLGVNEAQEIYQEYLDE